MWMMSVWPCLEADLDALLTDYCEDVQKMREAQQFSYALAEVFEDQLAACTLGGNVNTHQRTQAHAVHVVHVAEIEGDLLCAGEDFEYM